MQKITPFLWFDNQAEEAMNFYASVFGENAKITNVSRYGEGAPMPAGTVLTATIEIFGQKFIALNGGPHFSFTPAISFLVDCETQDEIDHYWNHFHDGGTEMQCGWISDKYGVTWQIIPRVLPDLIGGPEPEKAQRAMQAMMQMVKLDIAALQAAYDGR